MTHIAGASGQRGKQAIFTDFLPSSGSIFTFLSPAFLYT